MHDGDQGPAYSRPRRALGYAALALARRGPPGCGRPLPLTRRAPAALADFPIALAGLWERWHGDDGGPAETCAILTTMARAVVRPVHERMPVIVAPTDFAARLDPRTPTAELHALPRTYPAEAMEAVAVGSYAGNPRLRGAAVPAAVSGSRPASDALADEHRHPFRARHHRVVVAGRLTDEVRPRRPAFVAHQQPCTPCRMAYHTPPSYPSTAGTATGSAPHDDQ